MRVDEGGESYLSPWATIQVDLATLADVAASVESQVRSSLDPDSRRVMDVYATGVNFGYSNPSVDLLAAKQKYHDCLANTVAQLDYFVTASKVLADAVRAVVERYGSADALAEATNLEVINAIGDGLAAANLAKASAAAVTAAPVPTPVRLGAPGEAP